MRAARLYPGSLGFPRDDVTSRCPHAQQAQASRRPAGVRCSPRPRSHMGWGVYRRSSDPQKRQRRRASRSQVAPHASQSRWTDSPSERPLSRSLSPQDGQAMSLLIARLHPWAENGAPRSPLAVAAGSSHAPVPATVARSGGRCRAAEETIRTAAGQQGDRRKHYSNEGSFSVSSAPARQATDTWSKTKARGFTSGKGRQKVRPFGYRMNQRELAEAG